HAYDRSDHTLFFTVHHDMLTSLLILFYTERMNKMFDNLPFPSLFVCFLIFILWLHYEKRKSSREEKKRS
ncbi:hypothetical protein DK853_54990, partial [Klebsiella oxytoca]